MSRDNQRARVYGAEQHVRRILDMSGASGSSLTMHGSTIVLESELNFGTIDAVRAYVEHVQVLPWYRERYPNAGPLTVRRRRGDRKAHYRLGEISVHDGATPGAAWGMREAVVLHEMAHHVSPGEPHGPKFVAEFVVHVRQMIGESVAFLLQNAMYEADVRIGT